MAALASFAEASPADVAALRERIYGDVFPRLAEALAGDRHPARPTARDLAETHRMAMAALFRLLFLAHAGDRSPDGITDLSDFRGLSVRDFGAIYEGLLESELAVAEVDLTADRRGLYRPCRPGEAPVVEKGRVYLHNCSGARKATGTWFTKPFAVDHLLDQALEPALADHLARLDALDEATAAERLFDFRVADIAMGSGHFLLAAVDRIERAFRGYLARRPLPPLAPVLRGEGPGVRGGGCVCVQNLQAQCNPPPSPPAPLPRSGGEGGWEDMLRPLVARHCIFGVDLNPVAVDLARLTIALHTAVPGQLLAPPDDHLVTGNSLLHLPAWPEVFGRERGGFDVILGNPPWEKPRVEEHAFWARHVPGLRGLSQREQEALKARLRAERPDLVAAYGQELADAAALRRALTAGDYPGMGTGDPDLYKAFCWRFWQLLAADGGWMGIVLPRSALNAKGSAEFRRELFGHADPVDVTVLHNARGWVFDEAEHRYTIALVAACRRTPRGKSVRLRGPFSTLAQFREGLRSPAGEFRGEEVAAWTDAASLPLLPTAESLEVFTRLRQSPRLDAAGGPWRARPQTELHATADKRLMDLASEARPEGFWPVFKGESFDLWEPDTGRYYGWADPARVVPLLQEKRLRSSRKQNSAYAEFDGRLGDPRTLPCVAPRIAFRDITNRTNRRTVVAALVPPNVLLTHKAPFFLWPRGTKSDEAFLLGVLASLPLDWYARRFVETNLTYFILGPFPIPRPPDSSPLRRRVVQLAGRLAAADERFAVWAKAVGVPWGPLPADRKRDHVHELDAVVARLYGLEEKHVVHIFETFHEGWAYDERLREVLRHFRSWRA